METNVFRFMSGISVAAALLFNMACANMDSASVWKNSDYGSNAPGNGAATVGLKQLKPITGIAILN